MYSDESHVMEFQNDAGSKFFDIVEYTGEKYTGGKKGNIQVEHWKVNRLIFQDREEKKEHFKNKKACSRKQVWHIKKMG